MAKKTFSIEQIEAYQKLKNRQVQLMRWSESITEEMAKLERQKGHQKDELAEVSEQIKSKFAGLDEHEQLFVGAKYVTYDQKKILLDRCIMEYKALHPES